MPKYGGRLSVTDARASEQAVPEPHNAVKVSTACPSSLGLFPHAALTGAPTPDTAFRALLPKIPRKDGQIYEPVVRYVIRYIT
jgi:hypothetical protein